MSASSSPRRVLDLSGYGFSGKHAVIDLVREFEGYHVEHFQFEFALLRIQGGLLDLKTALVDDWSPIRSDAAIRRFRRLIRRIGPRNQLGDPRTWFQAMGFNYDAHYGGRFTELSQRYLDRLIEFSWSAEWPYAATEWGDLELFWRKLKSKLRFKNSHAVQMQLSWPRAFDAVTRDYLRDLLATNIAADVRTIVLHNAFEPFNPSRCLPFFDAAKCIIVDRDPRDNYVAGLWYKPTRLPVEKFITRYRIYREVAEHHAGSSPDVLRLRYEDLVLHYEPTVARILDFLGEPATRHVTPKKFFDPAVSRKNVGLWRSYEHQGEIEAIQAALGRYCHHEA